MPQLHDYENVNQSSLCQLCKGKKSDKSRSLESNQTKINKWKL